MPHNQHVIGVANQLFHSGRDHARADFGAFFHAFGNPAEKAVSFLIAFQHRLVAAAPERHVERLACVIFGIGQIFAPTDTDGKRYPHFRAVICISADLFHDAEFRRNHFLQFAFGHDCQKTTASEFSENTGIRRKPAFGNLFDGACDLCKLAFFIGTVNLVGAVGDNQRHRRAGHFKRARRLFQDGVFGIGQRIRLFAGSFDVAEIHGVFIFADLGIKLRLFSDFGDTEPAGKLFNVTVFGLNTGKHLLLKAAVIPNDSVRGVKHGDRQRIIVQIGIFLCRHAVVERQNRAANPLEITLGFEKRHPAQNQ